MKRLRIPAEQRNQFAMKNFYNLLAGRNAAKHTFAERFLFYASNEFSGDLKINIRFEQRHPNLAQCSVDIRFTANAMSTTVFENLLKFIAKLRKHEYEYPNSPSTIGAVA